MTAARPTDQMPDPAEAQTSAGRRDSAGLLASAAPAVAALVTALALVTSPGTLPGTSPGTLATP